MIRPQPDCSFLVAVSTSASAASGANLLAFLMKRRKTVSVTPAIGASTVAGAIRTSPIVNSAGTRASAGMVLVAGLSQNFCMKWLLNDRTVPNLPVGCVLQHELVR